MRYIYFHLQKQINKIGSIRHKYQLPHRDFHNTIQIRENDSVNCFWSANRETLDIVKKHFSLYENFVSIEEEAELMKEIDPIFKRRRYEFNHWDGNECDRTILVITRDEILQRL